MFFFSVRHPLVIFLFKCLFIGLGVAAAAATHPGIEVATSTDLVLVSLLVGFLNAFLRPLLILFTLPFVLLTLGLGLVVINALVVWLASSLVAGFAIPGFWAAVWTAILVSVASMIANRFFGPKPGTKRSGRFTYRARVRGSDGQYRTYTNREEGEAPKRIRARKDEDVIDI